MHRSARRIWLLTLVGGLLTIGVSACAQSAKVGQIPDEALVVDVRTEWEFKRGHFPGSKHVPLHEVKRRIAEFGPKDRPVVVYCHSGTRSGVAKDVLIRAGYKQVINGGGLEDMMRFAKTPVEDGGANP